jgi:hypothetical protein
MAKDFRHLNVNLTAEFSDRIVQTAKDYLTTPFRGGLPLAVTEQQICAMLTNSDDPCICPQITSVLLWAVEHNEFAVMHGNKFLLAAPQEAKSGA